MKAQNLIKLSVVVSVSLMISQIALAQGVGNIGSLPTQFPQTGTPPNGWIVTSTAGSIPVVLDPTGPAWGKSFTDPNGGNFFYPPTSPPNNPPLNVQEFLVVAPNSPPWTDWHEDVIGIDASGNEEYYLMMGRIVAGAGLSLILMLIGLPFLTSLIGFEIGRAHV